MLDRLIELILSVIHLFYFITVIDVYERAVVLRLGKFSRVLEPGWHFIMPFSVEKVLADNVVPTTAVLPAQSLTTKDGRAVVLSAIVTWSIADIKVLMLTVEGGEEVVLDTVAGEVGRAVSTRSWDSVQSSRFVRDVQTRVREIAEPYGIHIDRFQLRDISLCKSLRLFNEVE